MEVVCIDYLSIQRSKGGFENILVFTDHYTRYAQAIPTRNQTAQTMALFENFFLHYRFPARIHSDQGANFESQLIQSLCNLTGMKKTRMTPYHPMGNGMVERFNKTLLNMLGTLEESQNADWKSYVLTLTHTYNAAIHDITGFSPLFPMFGRHPRLAVDAFLGLPQDTETVKSHRDYVDRQKLRLVTAYDKASLEAKRSAERQKDYDEKVRHVKLEVGDRVLVEKKGHKGNHKLADLLEHCPYIVTGQPVSDMPVYEVVKENARNSKLRTLHRNMLLPFTGLPCPWTHHPATALKEKQPTIVADEELELSDTDSSRDSSESSAAEEEREIARYVTPNCQCPGQTGLLPRTNPLDRPAAPQPELQRDARPRRPPQWLRDDAWVRNQHQKNIHSLQSPTNRQKNKEIGQREYY